MKTTENTILITGGGSGIGLQIAKLLASLDNKIIITGRNKEKLENAIKEIPGATYIQCDVTNQNDVTGLLNEIQTKHQELNILINNAGHARSHRLNTPGSGYDHAQAEIMTNYLSAIRLTEIFLPLLSTQPEAAIINVSSVLAYVPAGDLPTYSASKAALHSYCQALRLSLENTSIKVFELLPPLVDTEFASSIPSPSKIKPEVVAQELLKGLVSDRFEIRVAGANDLYNLFLSSPERALKQVNSSTE